MTYTDFAAELDGVTLSFGDHRALDGVTLRLRHGVQAVLGPNGAGKTTTVRLLTTQLRPDSGRVRVLGRDTVRDAREVRRRISVTGQFAAVDEALTGRENLVVLGRLLGLRGRRAGERADQVLDRFDLAPAARRPVATYSGGMRRRLDLAASLLWRPEVLFLDEPTTGLDSRSRAGLWEQVRELAAEGTTVVLTTQYLEEADQLADHVVVLDGGRIVGEGSAAELKAQVGPARVRLVDAAGRVFAEQPTDGTADHLAALLGRAAANHPEARVEVVRPSLEDAFLALTGHRPTTPDADAGTETHQDVA